MFDILFGADPLHVNALYEFNFFYIIVFLIKTLIISIHARHALKMLMCLNILVYYNELISNLTILKPLFLVLPDKFNYKFENELNLLGYILSIGKVKSRNENKVILKV